MAHESSYYTCLETDQTCVFYMGRLVQTKFRLYSCCCAYSHISQWLYSALFITHNPIPENIVILEGTWTGLHCNISGSFPLIHSLFYHHSRDPAITGPLIPALILVFPPNQTSMKSVWLFHIFLFLLQTHVVINLSVHCLLLTPYKQTNRFIAYRVGYSLTATNSSHNLTFSEFFSTLRGCFPDWWRGKSITVPI